MRRQYWIVVGIVLIMVISGFGFLVLKKHSPVKKQATIKESKRLQYKQKEDTSALLVQIQEKMGQGDYLTAKQLCQRVIENSSSQEELELAEKLLMDINYKLLMEPIAIPGQTVEYEVKPGDTLYGIAKKFHTTVDFIKKRNHLTSDVIRPGQRLSIYAGKFSVVVDKSQNVLMLYANNELVKIYKVSTGKNNATPVGEFKIVTKLKNPTFFHNGKAIPPGDPKNILGTRWMGFDYGNGSYGIHGTTSPETIGTYETNGCIRMKNSDVEELYMLLPKGTVVKVVE